MDDATAVDHHPTPPPTASVPGGEGGPGALYGPDFYAWALSQAAALRGLAGRADLPPDLDLENLIEEVEGLARSDLRAVESLLEQLFVHLLKLHALPHDTAANHWANEADLFQRQAARGFSPSMARALDPDAIWRGAARVAARKLGRQGAAPPAVPDRCPFSLGEALDADGGGTDPLRARLAEVAAGADGGAPRRGRRAPT